LRKRGFEMQIVRAHRGSGDFADRSLFEIERRLRLLGLALENSG